ncbi:MULTISPECIES: photosystem II reaction center protein Ycf12/Psb30 [Roseofilum]|uniref:Photosystem II reaction center protein Psb30 n=3 Tax=Roseofilum TaxID=1233426 RepID=A0A1L9QMR8_9CYAN|nr:MULTISPECIES: photosystem II reaction center protein Ycf12 [Roseofilum]OJJ22733.1 photosystem II protein [Roseofilum reptotaenium AO1-A]HBQ98881.1 photosystem II reaction center protein Ycf12 [Cyanobacteria bacterium UBA11691]MBP0010082.1 photosystem II reaction center protein Ycf12 [Roseofilum sp. Belize Diploria]MBP0014795.1 photosystem II reaction center protein Ycf12 [Roseofilum sp. SID3]MBP0024156.1 photosystem II reaction center protein Ycf12 [Roseofilum sp. SID2]
MDFITNLFTGIDWILIAQLLMLTLVVVAGPAVIFVLFLRGGDL